MHVLPCTHLCVLLVFGEAAAKKNEWLHLLQKPFFTVITTRDSGSCGIRETGAHNIIEVVTQDLQGSIVLRQEQEVATLSECVMDGGQTCHLL